MNLFLILFMVVLCVLPADAKVISGAVAGANLPISEDTVIASGAWVFTDKMTIEKSVVLENYGRIETDVFLDSVNLYIKNYADFNSDFYLNDGANVFQIISDGDSFNLIDFNVDYGLVIDCVYGGLKFADVSDFAIGAQSVYIKDSILDFNGVALADLRNLNLTLSGTIILKMDDLSEIYDDVLFDNVFGTAQIFLMSENKDNLFTEIAYLSGGKIYVEQRRETDYVKIFNNDTGRFLNNLRITGRYDNLINRLDAAQSLDEIDDIMSQSVLFDSNRLIHPVKILDALNKNQFVRDRSGADAFALFAEDFDIYGLDLNYVMGDKDKALLYIVGQIATMRYLSELDSFDAMTYSFAAGANLSVWQGLSLNTKFGIGIIDFNVGDVLYAGKIYNNPVLKSGYALADFGYDFKLNNNWIFMPLVGMEYNLYDMQGLTQKYLLYRGGAEVRYTYDIMGLQYDCGARFVANSDKEYVVAVNGKFWSVADMIGGGLEFAIVHRYDDFAYQVSARFDVAF
ncbi:MAG: hypothetical protein IJN91_00135 [Alphaproteobacteria bacterium]|nr:hypothetical protein [Alphaproteobacteria bacterium]